jgi:hypothetical protein
MALNSPSPKADYQALWRVANKRIGTIHGKGFRITSGLLRYLLLDCEDYLRKRRPIVGLGRVLNELELRGAEGIPEEYLLKRKPKEVASE